MFIIPYDITCIDYLVHVYFTHLVLFTEDNNTRVLYERVLSSGQVPPEKSIEIWSRFLAFESEVGDLASIQKVEKRRAQAIEKVSVPAPWNIVESLFVADQCSWILWVTLTHEFMSS